MTTRPDFPLVWDNSMRSDFVSCPWMFFQRNLYHWKSGYPNVDLHAGGAWAAALEVARRAYYVDGASQETAEGLGLAALTRFYGTFECPPDSPKSLNRLAEAWVYYFTVFPFDRDPAQPYVGKTGPMIEFSFVLPLATGLNHPVTGDPILFAGRSDMVATFAGAATIYDDKTTKSLGPTWSQKWDRRAQFTGYTWAALEYGIPVTQVLIRGISILKTKLDHAHAVTVRTALHIREWHEQITRDIRRAMVMWEEGYWDKNLADSCDSYGGCGYKQPCMHPDPEPYLSSYFVKKAWDPVSRTETLLEAATPPSIDQTPWQVISMGNIQRKTR